ncbi:hypothetical protein ARMSODRAFT_967067 [Armillaria solidipes]|uniref:Uncharacterized protein n=1 Tax=Armillaria solidipes TaxID=1076256 RepID=A0A2H3AK42_9AGAR|nr:hypothetical protein ARMSODRAFT_967067 [Armillaria solidipes]
MSSSSTTVSPNVGPYKGKITHRSWAQLPEELVRQIATFYILDMSSSRTYPTMWDFRELWHARMAYTAIRDGMELERIMAVCPQWLKSLETHLFWHHAVNVLDPVDVLGHYAFVAPPTTATTNSSNGLSYPERLSPYQHYRNILSYSCAICRINYPHINHGLGLAKRAVRFPTLGIVGICRDHDRHKTSYCGVCYREATRERDLSRDRVGCMSNEDPETWPGIDATCKQCRKDGLFRRAYARVEDQEALGILGSKDIDDEARAAVEGFLTFADGSVRRTLETVQDRLWLKKQTRMRQFRSLVAANRYETREDGLQQLSAYRAAIRAHESDEDLDMDASDFEEEEEEDPEIEQRSLEDHSAKSMALGDWARNRILDGFWVTPCDQWISGTMLEVSRAEHPCPWTRGDEDDSGEERPRQATVMGDVPPSYSLCEHANYAYMKELRTLLLPPMKNIVRRLVIECAADGYDAVRKACKMTLDDVVHELKDEAVWFDGFDWLERRRNDRLEARKTEQRTRTMEESSSSDDSSLSSKSDGSTTSPVLSTSTLQTTPSPPPKEAILIPVSPILDPPRLLRPIPYIPESLIHLPEQSLEVFQGIWRDACRPLYHCRCKICERAKAAEGVVQIAPEDTAQPVTAAAEIRLPSPEVNEPEADDEDLDYDSYYDEEFYSEEDDEAWSPSADRKSPEVPDLPVRKRSLDDVAEPVRSGTPPKKLKVDVEVDVPEPRLKKRNSEELEVVEDGAGRKRFKTEDIVESPPMSLENSDHSSSVPPLEEEEAR